jgi:hypothetical protein
MSNSHDLRTLLTCFRWYLHKLYRGLEIYSYSSSARMDELSNLRFIYVLLNNKRSNTHAKIDTGYRRINLNTQGQLNVLPQRLPLMSTNFRKSTTCSWTRIYSPNGTEYQITVHGLDEYIGWVKGINNWLITGSEVSHNGNGNIEVSFWIVNTSQPILNILHLITPESYGLKWARFN